MSSSETRANRRLAHRTELPMALGCPPCPDHALCGGLKTDEVFFDCQNLCICNDEEKAACPHVCQSKPLEYARRLREVNTFDFRTIGPAPWVPVPVVPPVVAWIDGRGCLAGGLSLPAVAVPLRRLFHRGTGRAFTTDRAGVAARFAVTPQTPLVVTGVSYEQPIEDYWSRARGAGFLDELAGLAPLLVTTPNFSLFSDKPREDNLYNMKRIAICWHEMACRGIPTALHLNARTDRDWERWREFLSSHPEVGAVAFEFGTGAAARDRARWHSGHLCRLAASASRPLLLVARGGLRLLPELRSHFHRVAVIATDPLMQARKRRALAFEGGRLVRREVDYERRGKVDRLFLSNLAEYSRAAGGIVPDRDAAP